MQPNGSPTSVRYAVVAVTALMSVLLYLDRFCISFAATFIKQDLGLTDWQISLFLSAFFWTYALGQVPSGWLTDRFGSRLMLTSYVLLWSLFTVLTGTASVFFVLLILRFGFGLAQAGAYPTGASIIGKWVPFPRRGLASSIVALGGRVGGFLAMFATGYLIVLLTTAAPASVAPRDILNGPRFCYELQENARSPTLGAVAAKILPAMSPRARQVIDRQANDYREALESRPAAGSGSNENVAPQVAAVPAAELQLLADDVNRLIAQSNFFDAAAAELSLEREASRLLAKSELTDRQNGRLNRFVLESLHPDSLRKLYVAGWRRMMFIYGSLGLLVCGLIWWITRDRPAEHPRCNDAEVKLIEDDPRMMTTRGRGKVGRPPIKQLLCSRSIWLDCVAQWCTNVGWVFVMTWAPKYFEEVHQAPVETRAWMTSIPPLVGWAGMLLGGGLTDYLVKKVGLRWGRALPMSLSRFLAMGAYIVCLFQPSAWLAVAMLSIVTFATNLGTGAGWAFKQDVGGRHVGSVLGWGNMWGNLGAAVATIVLGLIVGETQNWEGAFFTCAMAFLIAGIACLGINATIPIAPEEEPDK